uniref:Uncharacterized protein n=1 Tax=Cacopsylla melanoneura TaxID=428564 RepID=A0A8D8L8Z3_9HEMI
MTRIPSRVLATPQTMMTKRVNFLTTCTLMGSTQRTTKPKPDTDTHCIIIQQSSQVRTRNGVEPSTREWILKKFELIAEASHVAVDLWPRQFFRSKWICLPNLFHLVPWLL